VGGDGGSGIPSARHFSRWRFWLPTAQDVSVETQRHAERLTPVKTHLHGGSPKLQRSRVTLFFLIFHVNQELVVCVAFFVLEFPIVGTWTAMVLVHAS
jgi:hypothetical protein